MTNNQVCELAHNWRTTGAPDRFKVRRFAPVRQLRQLLYNWQLERRRGPRPESTGKRRLAKTTDRRKIPEAIEPRAVQLSFARRPVDGRCVPTCCWVILVSASAFSREMQERRSAFLVSPPCLTPT
jgi:hypothetical protein